MNAFSRPLRISEARPVDEWVLRTIRLIDGVLQEAHVPYMLVGATARDLLLHHVHGQAITRFTYDVDFAILVDSWEQFEAVRQALLSAPGGSDRARMQHRLHYSAEPSDPETVVDIIPFGGLEDVEGRIAWPPDDDVVMNMGAFQEVFDNAIHIELESNLIIRIPSIAGLTILKLFAWIDRRNERDLLDIRRLLETYADSGNLDRLYEEEPLELERLRYDATLAGAFLLGRDARAIIDQNIVDKLTSALRKDLVYLLVNGIANSLSKIEDRTESATTLLKEFFDGLGIKTLF